MTNENEQNESVSRIGQLKNRLCNTGMESVGDWGDDFIKNNLPMALDLIVEKVRLFWTSFKAKNNASFKSSIREAIKVGFEAGEANKENAMIYAMVQAGIQENQIKEILDNSNRYLVTWESLVSKCNE